MLSLFSQTTRNECIDPELFKDRIWQASRRDRDFFDSLKLEKRFDENTDVESFRSLVLEFGWKSFKDAIPELRKQLTLQRKIASDGIQKIKNDLNGMELQKLRSTVSNYVADWTQIVIQLFDNTNQASSSLVGQMGQTLEEEFASMDSGDFFDFEHKPIQISNLKGVKSSELSLLGGHQFERLLSTFRAILKPNELFKISIDQIKAAAIIISKPPIEKAEFLAIASHIIRRKVRLLEPYIKQLCLRGSQIMKRLADIAFVLVKKDNKYGSSADASLYSLAGYTYFCSVLRDLYFEYIDSVSNLCQAKCLEEISAIELIYWDYNYGNLKIPKMKGAEDAIEYASNFTSAAFYSLSQQIITNIVMKCHNYFLVVAARDISGRLLKDVSSFNEKAIEEMFELDKTRQILKQEEERESKNLQMVDNQEKTLRDLVTQFSRFKLG